MSKNVSFMPMVGNSKHVNILGHVTISACMGNHCSSAVKKEEVNEKLYDQVS